MGDLFITQNPGDLIKSLLIEKGFTQADLAMITGFSRQSINNIISGRSNITPETAVALATAFGNEAAEWLRLDNEYRLASLKDDNSDIEKRSSIMQLAPIRDMQKRGWISQTEDFQELENELKEFFEADNLQGDLHFQAAYLKSAKLPSDDKAIRAWCFRARQIAKAIPVNKYDEKDLSKLETELRKVAAYAKETHRVAHIFAKYGIRFVIIEHLPQTKIDGAAFWLDENSPVIAISIRHDRIDNFWFTVMHEFDHIKNRDALSIDDGLKESLESHTDNDLSDKEKRANKNASASLIDPKELESFIGRVSPLYSEQRIIQFAHRIKIHPGIIVGQLQNREEISFSTHRKLLAKVRDTAIETALTDGWGKTLPSKI
ncbi:MAG: HigA family addiction module antitoxin [Trueperaceae bacterium]